MVLEAVKQRAEAEGKTLDQATDDVVRLASAKPGGSVSAQGGRDDGCGMTGAVSDEASIATSAVDAVHERAEQRGRAERNGRRRFEQFHQRQLPA